MRIYKKVYPILFVELIILLLFNFLFLIIGINTGITIGLAFLSFLLLVFTFAFFRIPERKILPDHSFIYSPADGKVVNIEEIFEDEYLRTKCIKVSVFMSVFNVHQNWIPFSGKVVYVKHHPGKHIVAWHPKSSKLNEHNSIVIEAPDGQQFLIRQIAGLITKRIICDLKINDLVKQGDELGFILFGSRVDIFFPTNTNIIVNKGDRVKGNKSVVAKLNFLEL